MKDTMNWGTLGSVRPSPVFQPEKDVSNLKAALEQKDVDTLVRILTNRSNAQRRNLAETFRSINPQNLDVSLKTVLNGDLEVLILDLMMTPEQFEAHRLRRAMEGLGSDEETLLEILCLRSAEQLSKLAAAYNQEFQRDLENDLSSETSGDLRKLLRALLKKQQVPENVDQDVKLLCKELNNSKPDITPWIQVLTMRDPDHIQRVLIHLEAERGQPVTTEIEKHFGESNRDARLGLQVLVLSIQDPYLYLAQRIQLMKDSLVQGVLMSHCEEDLLAVRVAFKKNTGKSLYSTIQDRFKGEIQQVFLALCRYED